MTGMEEVVQAQKVGKGCHVVGQLREAEGSSVPLRPAPASRIVDDNLKVVGQERR